MKELPGSSIGKTCNIGPIVKFGTTTHHRFWPSFADCSG